MSAAAETFLVCMVGATKRASDGTTIRGDAYLGRDLQFSTLDPHEAKQFDRFEAERYADHWRGWYRGFAGGCVIELREYSTGGAWCPIGDARAALEEVGP